MSDEPYGYDYNNDGWIDGEDQGSFFGFDFDGDGDIDTDDDLIGGFLAYEAHQAGHCYIATAIYGDYDHPQVRVLRKFRDQTLAQSQAGRRLIQSYYWHGPDLAAWMEPRPAVKKITRCMLNWMVFFLRRSQPRE